MKQVRWKSFDVLKGLACIAVVFIHYNFKDDIGLYVKTFCRFAVPVFFIISGFFFLSNGKMDDAKVVSKIRHIVHLLVGSGIFYAFFTVVENNINNPKWNWTEYILSHASAGKIVKFFFTNDPLVYSHLWYMLALIYCYILSLFLFNKSKRLALAPILASILLIIYSCLQEFGAILGIRSTVPIPGSDLVLCLFNLSILRALPFFLFGMIIRKYQTQIARIPLNLPIAVLIFVAGGLLAIYERSIFRESQFYVGTYIMVAVLTIMAIKKPESEVKFLGYIGRELSLYVYILHIAVGKLTDIIAREIGFRETMFYTWGRAFIILFATLLISQVIILSKYFLKNMIKEK